jgi:hypothetical protein
MTPDEIGNAIRAFRSKSCPACEGEKGHLHDTFCTACTASLPKEMREGIANRDTYLETFGPSMLHLDGVRQTALSSDAGKSTPG